MKKTLSFNEKLTAGHTRCFKGPIIGGVMMSEDLW